MKILITSIVDLEKAAHNRLHEFVRYLCQHHSLTVISINDWWRATRTDVSLYRQSFEDILSTIKIIHLTDKKLSPPLQELFSPLLLNGILEEVDYAGFDVHLNYNTLISGYYVARKLKSKGINTVYDIADDLPSMLRISPQVNPLLRPFGQMLGSFMLKRNVVISDKTVCTTEYLRNLYRIPQSKSELIPNGVDAGLFKNRPSAQLRKRLGVEGSFVVGYVGVLREWIDLEPVFMAVNRLHNSSSLNIKVLVVGEEGGLKKAKALALEHGVAERVIFTGTVPYNQVPDHISCMDVCLLPYKADAPSISANSPLKMLEYMACGKPVIASRETGVSAEFKDKMLYAANVDEYAERLARLYNDHELRQKMGMVGRELVEQGYSWSESARKLEGILETVAKK